MVGTHDNNEAGACDSILAARDDILVAWDNDILAARDDILVAWDNDLMRA
jgi:hypothetical protein